MTARARTAPTPPRVPSPEHVQRDPGHGRRLAGPGPRPGSRSSTTAWLTNSMAGSAVTADDQGPFDLGSGGVSAGVGDPVAVMATLPGQRQRAGRVPVELRAAGDQLGHLVGTLGDQHADRFLDAQARAGDQGVLDVLVHRVPAAWTEAIPPWAQCVDPAASSSLVTTITRPRSRHSNAAVSPAIPDPMTSTSTSRTQPGGSARKPSRHLPRDGSGGSSTNDDTVGGA